MNWYVIKQCLGNHSYRDLSPFYGDERDVLDAVHNAQKQKPDAKFVVQKTDAPVAEKPKPAVAKRKK